MGAILCTARSIGYETEPPDDNCTDGVWADVFSDGVKFHASGLRVLNREECLELAAWLVEAAELIQSPAVKKPSGIALPAELDTKTFSDHLRGASETVAAWPSWKRDVLGR